MLSIKLSPVERIRVEPWFGLGLGLGTQADALQLSETRSWYVVKSSSSILQTWTVIWILSMDPITFNDQVGYLTKNLWLGILIVLHVRESHGFIHQTLNPYSIVFFGVCPASRQKVHHIILLILNYEANEGSLQQTCNMATRKRSCTKFYQRISIFQLN